MLFDINSFVRVKLTGAGRDAHRCFHDRLVRDMSERAFHHIRPDHRLEHAREVLKYAPVKEDQDGWSYWQLWVLMKVFGPHTHLGDAPMFETNIDIPVKEATAPAETRAQKVQRLMKEIADRQQELGALVLGDPSVAVGPRLLGGRGGGHRAAFTASFGDGGSRSPQEESGGLSNACDQDEGA